ncbi:MAG: hypothetical protein JXB06_04325, partial [Spirochaetales bacterium]|nr:hypothetical protein [Spirochaetales bacterium]
VHGVPVYLGWDEELLVDALRTEEPVFYLSTNSRALSSESAARLGYQIGRNLRSAAQKTNSSLAVCSRSDLTLRGHYPAEVEAPSDGPGTDHRGGSGVEAWSAGALAGSPLRRISGKRGR